MFAVPGLATVIVGLVKFLDRYGICPKFLIEELPFHVGMYITNTASIGLHEVNHHIYNFGNVGLFFGMGTSERVAVEENGTLRLKRFLPIGITADERVCSGAHYARFFADMRRYLDHPELLEEPPFGWPEEENVFYLRVRCSKGTYVRTLCHDIGAALGCGGCMSTLRRTEAGGCGIGESLTLEEVLAAERPEELLRPVDGCFQEYPALTITGREVFKAKNGNPFAAKVPDGDYRVYADTGEFLLLGRAVNGRVSTMKSFFEV